MPHMTIGHESSAVVELYYEDHGTGQPAVLIHGYPLDGRSWDRQASALLSAGYRVITYDRRGFGRSSPAAGGYDYDTFAADLHSLLVELDLGETVLIGHATGTGDIARYLSAHGSARVAKAVFLASLPPFLLRTGATPHGVELSYFDALIVKARRQDRRTYFAELHDIILKPADNLASRIGVEAMDTFLDIAAASSARACVAVIPTWITDFRPDIAAIDVPVLIVHGTGDRLLPIEATGRPLHALLPQATYVEIADAPHGLLWTHAEDVNGALLTFLGHSTPG
ncbi:alpha/beta hydrolase [Streptomyces sp. 4503]|uniref:Alpha/beta hydrolase n=1 Tax=Streptomyces niphimycinicus TaxID=2842201 RepID=A0ABS6CJ09_9ACTN|nr:alpha/beta hydrolase [Streptomyces niphimycinicus]MBU3866928.1 alpha/beta hydrolase [Streptomyces niphimycinicus]